MANNLDEKEVSAVIESVAKETKAAAAAAANTTLNSTDEDVLMKSQSMEGKLNEIGTNEDDATTSSEQIDESNMEKVEFKIMFCKQKHDISFALDKTVGKLKEHLQTVIGVPASMQKIMIKGLAKDDQTLRTLGVTKGSKVLVVGSKIDDILSVSAPTADELAASQAKEKEKEALCTQTVHRKILDKGVPDDAMPGIKDLKEPLPHVPLSGMVNKQGKKVRLTFKLEADQLWIGTQQRTEKVTMNSIKAVVSEPITGHEEYHILALQLGPTEASRYWLYWVPAQYVDAIKDAILG